VNTVYFDLETQKGAQEVGGWGNKHLMRVSIGVCYSTETGAFKAYEEDDMPELISALTSADLVVGYNIFGFDYAVLSAYSNTDFSRLPSLDLMTGLSARLGFRPKLDSLAQATLNTGKSAHGLMALEWFQSGEFAKIALYCREDVRITRDLHCFGREHGFVYCPDRRKRPKKVPVTW